MSLIRHVLTTALAITGITMLPVAARSQGFEGSPCKLPGNPALRTQLGKGLVAELESYSGNYARWATSFLAPSGRAPAKPRSTQDDEAGGYEEQFAKWSCQYDPGKAQDGDSTTAWVEGVAGQGVGEILIAQVNTGQAVQIWAGYGKSPALHAANSRPRKVRVLVLQALVTPDGNQVGSKYRQITRLASGELELRDTNGFQALRVPAHALRQAKSFSSGEPWPMNDSQYEQMTFVAIEIVSVYPGTKFKDTAISEVRNVPPVAKTAARESTPEVLIPAQDLPVGENHAALGPAFVISGTSRRRTPPRAAPPGRAP